MKYLSLAIMLISFVVFTWCGISSSREENDIHTYTLQDVETHSTADACRSIIRNQVYDFTTRASQHPWWSGKILAICGTDATPTFEKMHGGKEKPEMKLEDFYIGDIE